MFLKGVNKRQTEARMECSKVPFPCWDELLFLVLGRQRWSVLENALLDFWQMSKQREAPRVMQEMASSDRLCQALVFRNSHWSPTSPPSTLQISTVKDAFCTERGGDTGVCFQRCRSYLFVFVLFCDNQAENQSNGVLAVCTIFVLQI